MARRTKSEGSGRRGKGTKRSVDFSQAVADFEGDMEYPIEVKEAEWKEGEKGDYLALVFKGEGEFEETTVYHNASFAPRAMARTKTLLIALGAIEEDAEDVDIDSKDLIGLKCMGHTFYEKDQNGTPRIRFDDFWELDGETSSDKEEAGEESEIDFDELSDADVKKLAKALKIKGRDADKLREELADADEEDVREAAEELDISLSSDTEEEEKEEPKGKGKSSGRASSKGGSKKSKDKQTYTEDAIQEMSEDELEAVIEESGIDVDLDDHKTLRKKKNAVIDALTEAELLDD